MQSPDDYDVDVDNYEIDAKHLTVYVNAKVLGDDRQPLGVCGVGVRMTADEEANLYGRISSAASAQDVGEGVQLTMSCGMVSRRERPAESVSELCRIADKRMYDDKVRYYERTGATRRTS